MSSEIEVFSGIEQPPLLEQIKRILDEYRNDVQIIKELIQNADDAEATSMKILYEGRTINQEQENEAEYRKFLRAPALVFYNDAQFTDEDWIGIRSIYTSVKRDDPLKIGRFGLGFKSVFHLTDFPSIISGEYAMFINPHAKDFGKICVTVKLIHLKEWHRLNCEDYMNSLDGTFGFSEQTLTTGKYEGTMFWFPLRQTVSPLSETVYPEEKVIHLLHAFKNESNRSLIFLKTLCSIQLFIDVEETSAEESSSSDGSYLDIKQMRFGKEVDCYRVEIDNKSNDLPERRIAYLQELKDIGNEVPDQSKHWVFTVTVKTVTKSLSEDKKVAKARWLIVNYLKGGDISENTRQLMNDKELGYPHVVSLAAPLNMNGEYISTAGHVFCYQPLPQENVCMTGLPVHINGFFALSQNRRQVRWPDQGDPTNGDGDKKIEWNIALRSEILPDAYDKLIAEIISFCLQGQNQKYLLKAVHNAIPDLSVVTEHWSDLASKVIKLCKDRNILYTEQGGGRWITADEAVFTVFQEYPGYNTYQKTVYDLLFADNINLVSVPQHVLYALETVCPSLKYTSPAFVKSHLENQETFKELTVDQKQDLLEFVFLDSSKLGLENLELLPLEDGKFETFDIGKQVLLEDQDVVDLFPGHEANFVCGSLRHRTKEILKEIMEEGAFCLRRLSEETTVKLLNDILSENFDVTDPVVVCNSDVDKWKTWVRGIWNLIQQEFRKSVHKFNDVPMFPLVSDSKWENVHEFSLLKLMSTLFYIPSFDELDDQEDISSSFNLLSVSLVKYIPEDLDIDVVRPFLHEETSESISELIDRVDEIHVERFNRECSDEGSQAFLKFFSERIHTKVGKTGLRNLRHLKIFRGYKSLTEGELVSLSQIDDIYEGTEFPVRFPKQIILLKSDSEKTFAKHLGANVVSELELVRLTLTNIDEYDCDEKQRFVHWIVTDGLHFSYHDVQERLKEIEFLEATDGSFHKVNELFDPSITELCNLFRNEHVFPKIQIESDQQYLTGLRTLGLKTVKGLKNADIEHICCKIHEMADVKVDFDKTVCLALLDIMNRNGHLVEKDRLYNKRCVFIEDTVVENFPQFIPLKNRNSNTSVLLCMPGEIKSVKLVNLVGSVMHMIDCKHLQALSNLFDWETSPEVAKVVENLFNVVQHYKPEHKPTCLPVITSMYNYLSNDCSVDEVKDFIQSQFISPREAFVWDGNAFQPAYKVYTEIAKGDVDMKPFLHPLPVEITHLSAFFVQMGCRKSLEMDMYIHTLEQIKDSEHLTDDDENISDAFTDMAIAILNRIKKNFLQEFKDSGKQLYFPTVKENNGLQMMPAGSCTYCDEQWLKNMDFRFDDDTHYVHPELPLATAEALGVPSLRQQMMSDTEAFEECGQDEPLTRRLRNLLKEGYVDGFSVAKELFQNADDAGAKKLWILFDERENNSAKTQLISEEMADCQGPAIWVYNDEMFTEDDFKNITKLSGATKEDDSSKIGKFGLGFCAVYNVTDVPSFVSGENFIIFDPDMSHLGKVLPGRSPGLRVNFRVMKNLKMMKSLKNQFMPFEDVFGCRIVDSASPFFNGTLFRLPLRNKASDISDVVYSPSEVKDLFEKIMSMAANMLLFNQNVVEFKLFHLPKSERNPSDSKLLFEVSKISTRLLPSTYENVDILPVLVEATRRKQTKSLLDNPLQVIDQISVNIANYVDSKFQVIADKIETNRVDWLVCWSSGSDETALRLAYEEKGALPLAAVAIPVISHTSNNMTELEVIQFKGVSKQFYEKGHLFFFLPLPIQHRFPFHINSQFTVTSDRRQLKTSSEDDKNVKMKKWNKYLLKDSVTNALLYLLEHLHCLGVLKEYQYDLLWPRYETAEILEYLPPAFYKKVVKPEMYNVFQRDGQWFDISRCVFIERRFRSSAIGDVVFEVLSDLTEFVVDVSEDIYGMLLQANQPLIEEKTVSMESFFLDYFFPHLEDFTSDTCTLDKRKRLLYYAVDLQNDLIDQWLKANACIPSQPYGNLKRPNELVDTNSTLSALFVTSDGYFPECPFNETTISDKLRMLGLMYSVLSDSLVTDRAASVEHLSKSCSVCALERSAHLMGYLNDNISKHKSALVDVRGIRFIPVQTKPQDWSFEWHADIFSSNKKSKKCKTHRKTKAENQPTFFDRASNVYFSHCKNIIGCIAFVFDEKSYFSYNSVNKSLNLKSMLKTLGMNGIAVGEVDVHFVMKQLEIVSASDVAVSDSIHSFNVSKIMTDIYRYLDKACESKEISDYIAGETKDKAVVFMTDAFVKPQNVSRNCLADCKPYLFRLNESPLKNCATLYNCLGIGDNFSPYHVAMILQNIKQEQDDTPLCQSEIHTMINILFCLRNSIEVLHDKTFEVQSIVTDELQAIYGPDENRILRDCKTMCFNDFDEMEKSDSMIYAHGSFPPDLAKYFGVKPKTIHKLEECSEDIEDFYQDEPLVTRLNRLVEGYPCDSGIFKELMQNADDAGATEIHFIKDYTTHPNNNIIDPRFEALQGPALVVCNNSAFSNDDLGGIQRLGRGSKSEDPSQTGRYGVGFNAVYNLTDAPSFYTKGGDIENGETICFFDPLANYIPNVTRKKPGKRYKDVTTIRILHSDMMNGYHDKILIKGQKGTIFRFPLRTKFMAEISEIKQESVDMDKISSLLAAFVEDLSNVMLFLKNLRTVKVLTCKDNTFVEDFCIDVTMSPTENTVLKDFVQQQKQMCEDFKRRRENIFKFEQYTSTYELSMTIRSRDKSNTTEYIVVQTLGFDQNKQVNHLMKESILGGKLGLLPHGGVALRIKQKTDSAKNTLWEAGTNCKAFCFLPLPIETGLPVHVHGYFALDHETRRSLWKSEESEKCYRSLWNQTLIEHVVSVAYVALLQYTRNIQFREITNKVSSWETVTRGLSNYQTLFPLERNMKDDYWKHLLCSVYRRLVAECVAFLPVQNTTTNMYNGRKTVQLTWTSLNIIGSNFPAYIKAEDVSESGKESYFNNILRRIGMRIVYISDEIKEALDFSETGIALLKPQHVIEFMCCHDRCEQNECKIETGKHVVQTALQSVGDAAQILRFCLKDLKSVETNLETLPLMITQDNYVRKVPAKGFYFVEERSCFCHFFPTKLQQFLHSSIATDVSIYLITQSSTFQDKLKSFTLSHFVQLVQETNQIEHNCTSAKSWDKSNPSETWIRLFWDFLLYKLSAERSQNMCQQLQVVQYIPLIPVTRPLSGITRIVPPCCITSLLNLDSFQAKRFLHSALEMLDFPQISSSYFSEEFMSTGFELLLKEVPNFSTPLKVLECLYLNSREIELSSLSDQFVKAVLWYFNDCLGDKISAQDIAKLKDMPLFLSHFGKRVVLKHYSTIFIVPKKLPAEGLEDLADKAHVLFLRNTEQKHLFKLMNLTGLPLIQVYTLYIVPQQHLLNRTCFYGHLYFLSLLIITEKEENTELLALLRRTAFVEAQNEQLVCVSDLFDSDHEVFKTMCEDSELVPLCLRDFHILNLFRKIGLKSQMTITLFERFARQISSREKTESLSERVKKDSKLLSEHLLDMADSFFAREVFENLPKIPFVIPYIVNDRLSSIKEQFNCTNLICFEEAMVNMSQKISWTVSNILPIHADPTTKYNADLIIQKLKICKKPSLPTLVRHCENVGKSVEKKVKLPNTICHKELKYVMGDIYDALETFVDSDQFTDECVQTLAHVPIVYYPDTKIIVTAKRVTIACKTGEEIPPYFLKCPDSYLQYKKIFLGLGASEEPSCNSFARVLHDLKDEADDTKLNPKEYSDAIEAMGHLYKYLAEEEETAIISGDQLFLLSVKSTLEHARKLIIPNNMYLKNQLAKSDTTTCVYHIGFQNLREFHLKSEDYIENLKRLPEKCRPYLLTDVVKEKVILANIKHEDRRKAAIFEEFILCNDFVFGFLRLVRHVWKSNDRDWKQTDEAVMSKSLKSIEIIHCSGIETKLALRNIENGNLGREILIENTNESKFSHIEVNEETACVFFDSSHPKWRKSVINHLTVYLNGLADHCFKDRTIVILMDILEMYENPGDIGLHLSQEQIEEYTFQPITLDDRPSYPIPGTIVPKQYHEFLDNEFVIFEYDFKFIALEVDDPALDVDNTEDGNENDEETGENMEATYKFVHIIRKIGPENELPLFQEYEINCGSDSTITVKGSQLFKFIRKRKTANNDQRQVVIYKRTTDGEENESKSYQREAKPFKEVLSEIRKYLREAWKKDEQERRRIVKRLMLRWHPDKNPDNILFCTKVFQYIQKCLNLLEKGLELTDDDSDDEENGINRNGSNSGSSGTYRSYPSSNGNYWYNRYWRRYTRGRQYNERRYEQSRHQNRQSGRWYNNFDDTWRARHTNTHATYEPYHWYSRARLWYTQAEYDLQNAEASMQRLLSPQFNWVCYNAHQAAEKALKAVWYAKDANKVNDNLLASHSLEYIATGVGPEVKPLAERLSKLTGEHTKMTYPDPQLCKIPAESFSKRTAESVIEIAQDILRVCSSCIKQG